MASAGIDAVLSGLSQWVASGAEWLLSQIGNVLVQHDHHRSRVRAGSGRTTAVMTALAGVVVLPLLLVSTVQAVYRQSASQLVRSFFVQLPLALLLGVVAIQIVHPLPLGDRRACAPKWPADRARTSRPCWPA